MNCGTNSWCVRLATSFPSKGSRNRVHEALNRRRSLTIKMIWRLHEGLGIPAESLIKVGQEHAA